MEKKIKSVKLRLRQFLFDKCFYEQQEIKKLPPHLSKYGEEYVLETLGSRNFISEEYIRINEGDIFEIEYEPERKFIDVRIEYDGSHHTNFSANNVENVLSSYGKFKVTELPEVFTREDMIDFAYKCRHLVGFPESRIDKFISERKSNGR